MKKLIEFLLSLFQKPNEPIRETASLPQENEALEIATRFIAKWEGLRLEAYQDVVGVWTIGYGRTTDVRPGDRITKEQADYWLREEVKSFNQAVREAITHPMAPHEEAAMTSLAYNIGKAAFKRSSVARLFNEGQVREAASAFLLWNKAGGQVINGLVNRRHDERDLFLGGL